MNIPLTVTNVLTKCLTYLQIYTYACTIIAYPVKEFKGMLRHIESQLPSIMILPISLDKTLHFYKYLKTHVLVAEEQFLLLIDVPIQDRVQHHQTYEIFNLPVPHGDILTRYKINDTYIGITYDETQMVVITDQQYSTCLHTNG